MVKIIHGLLDGLKTEISAVLHALSSKMIQTEI